MLDSFRKIANTWFGKLLGAILIVGLAGFGISNVITNIGSTTVAKVGDEEITAREFQRAYSSQLDQLAQRLGQSLTAEQAVGMGVPSVVIDQLSAQAAIDQFGAKMGIGVSDDRLGKMLREDPSFSGTLGQFDRTNFLRVLQQVGYTENEYFELQRRASRRQQLVSGLLADTVAPQAAQQLVARYSGDTRTLDYFVVNAQSILPVAEPTEEELAAYLAEHQAEFRTAETRTVDLVALTPEALAASKTITEEEIAAEYERTKASRTKAERRQIVQVPLTAEQEAQFAAGKQAGKTFDQMVAEAALTPTDLGMLAQSEVTDPQLAEAAFALAQGDFAVIPGIGGKRAVMVSAIEAGGATSLDEAREQIRQSLAITQARNELVDILDQIEELRAAFRPLTEIADRFGLALHSLEVTASGAELAEVAGLAEDARPRVAEAIFAASPDDKLVPTISLGANHHVWFDLKSVEPARDQTLAEVRDAVAAAWTAEKTEAALIAQGGAITERLKAGEAFADVAVSLNQFPILSQPLKRGGDGTNVLNQDVAAAAFSGGSGHFGSAKNSDGDYVLFQVVDVTPAAETPPTIRSYLEQANQQSLFDDFIAGVRDEAGLRIYRQVLDQLIGLDATTGQ